MSLDISLSAGPINDDAILFIVQYVPEVDQKTTTMDIDGDGGDDGKEQGYQQYLLDTNPPTSFPLPRLTDLRWAPNNLSGVGLELLSKSQLLDQLIVLDIGYHYINQPLVVPLLTTPLVSNLQLLCVPDVIEDEDYLRRQPGTFQYLDNCHVWFW